MDDRLIELESALQDDCTVDDIYAICHGKALPEALRLDVWQVCLGVRNKMDQMAQFNEIYDLPFQAQLRADCEDFVNKLGNEDEDKVSVVCDLESILTFYCKNRALGYEPNNGWVELMLPLLSLKLIRSDTYNLFEAIRDTYIPKGCVKNGTVFNVFRLLLLYHDPELCTILDTKRITPDCYAMGWFQTLFASTCTLPVVLSMWDLYFQQSDPFLVFFLSLIVLINQRDQILLMKTSATKEELVSFLVNMPCNIEADDVLDFCSLAQYYSVKTPASFKRDLLQVLFGAQSGTTEGSSVVSQALCLPVSVNELIENASIENPHPEAVRFFLVDCRPAEQYNAGHLSTAFHLDSNLMLQEPEAFQTAVQGLLRSQRNAIDANSNAGGEHLCFLGSGRLEEDQYTHMVVASFLQKNTKYVSLLTGGYEAIHEYFGEGMVDCLEDHDPLKCLLCNKEQVQFGKKASNNNNNNQKALKSGQQQRSRNHATNNNGADGDRKPTIDLFSKLSLAMKTKSAEVREKLFDYISNPNATTGGAGSGVPGSEKHVSRNDRNGKRYRNVPPVFSIGEDHEEDEDLNSAASETSSVARSTKAAANNRQSDTGEEIVSIQSFLKSPDVIRHFKCKEVHLNGYMYDSYLLVTATHMIVLRELETHHDQARIIVRRSLQSIVKITAKKRHRDLITFKYGYPEEENLVITDMDRFLIPKASEVTDLISRHIIKQT
ncbi:TBC1 domain family member 23 isoform X2 [Anopheles ziemanni]|uniref:TBC1 domain family member 23 isoform X2 n=1 Tax=Anopheles coustani TaxID=139045 RepID=UPI002659CC08|nr:TBC1 domain family member 23 isoform X2 [Anopheles coustani]XP_058166999.1 TBC1 domain family member 23 isoform X2 [Anopheles ziemanni]